MDRLKILIHWFRRDLRLTDNTALAAAGREAAVVPFYVLDPERVRMDGHGPAYWQFHLESLRELSAKLEKQGSRLILREGALLAEMERLAAETGANGIFFNRLYEPASVDQEQKVAGLGRHLGIEVRTFKDYVLHEGGEVRTGSGSAYTIFTPYAKKWETLTKARPVKAIRCSVPPILKKLRTMRLPSLGRLGMSSALRIPAAGEKAGLDLLRRFVRERLAGYDQTRDFPAVDGTSRLSPHLCHGTVSIRSVYHAALAAAAKGTPRARRAGGVYLKELVWREFFSQVLAQFPFVGRGCFRPQYDRLKWRNREDWFLAWREGRTGYPLVDAAMRQLRETGWMHNRLRMMASMFLTKDLLIDWRWGERYFMEKLADGDMASNNGGWQWSAGTGTDAAPYFRIFSPARQSRRFDPGGVFIRQWLPGLVPLSAAEIHAPWLQKRLPLAKLDFPEPVVNHEVQRQKTLDMFDRINR
ncbi:MAG: deoxyribodipyrimidine photo-lyase [Verrucomicrobiae bacterium]|nr:deoxyribodipyrimidine photo-lyase [Verrucomicrobiae bacterium]